jgi:hypothetical protein
LRGRIVLIVCTVPVLAVGGILLDRAATHDSRTWIRTDTAGRIAEMIQWTATAGGQITGTMSIFSANGHPPPWAIGSSSRARFAVQGLIQGSAITIGSDHAWWVATGTVTGSGQLVLRNDDPNMNPVWAAGTFQAGVPSDYRTAIAKVTRPLAGR